MRLHPLHASLLGLATACGDGDGNPDGRLADAGPDAADDPFAGMYDDPSEFAHTNCTPGSLTGFSYVGLYRDPLYIRTDHDVAGLHTYVGATLGEREVPHTLTADDLIVRSFDHYSDFDVLNAFDACAADPFGVLRGSEVYCLRRPGEDAQCIETPFEVAPLRPIDNEWPSSHLTLIGELNGSPVWPRLIRTTNVRVDGTIAAVSRYGDGLRVVSVAEPDDPIDLGFYPYPDGAVNDVKLLRATSGALTAVLGSIPVHVVDLSTPSAPRLVADLGFGAHTVFVEGTRAYFASGTDGVIPVYDLADPARPVLLGRWEAPEANAWYHDLYVEDGVAYLAESSGGGLDIVDLSDPARPARIGFEAIDDGSSRYWHSAGVARLPDRTLALSSDEGEGSGLRVLEGDPDSPAFLSTISEWHLRDEVSIHNFEVDGSRAYIAHYLDGVRVVDLAVPESPTMIGWFNTWIPGTETALAGGTQGVDIDPANRRIYVADAHRGLLILQGDATVFP
jgi:hypothetical protein